MLMAINLDNYRDQFGNLQSTVKLIEEIVSHINTSENRVSTIEKGIPWVSVTGGSNMNSYVNDGNYAVATNAIANTVQNIPSPVAGWLRVRSLKRESSVAGDPSVTWATIMQDYITLNQTRFTRIISSDGTGNWTYGTWTSRQI